jgi:radical SAM superfamily enzyme YgiQ (UPF0313 family)
MKLLLINPSNPQVSMTRSKNNRWSRYRVWKPLGRIVLAGLTPAEWEVSIVDENLGVPDYADMPPPDLVGITAFTSQATRAYDVADCFRSRGVPVIMGGIHATMCLDEALEHVDTVVTGEAESVWAKVLNDAAQGLLQRHYDGGVADISSVPHARHDLTPTGYAFGAIQTTRGCPLNCTFCSVSAFNGTQYRQRAIADVVREYESIREKYVLFVDDNLIGTSRRHIARAKDLFRTLSKARVRHKWIAQVTINFADDEELLALAAEAGCQGVFIGFESPSTEGLLEVAKKFNTLHDRDFRASVRRIQRHRIQVVGSFIIGLDADKPGIGRRIAKTAAQYGVDNLNVLFLTPFPGTRLWNEMQAERRICFNRFPEDWQYYTLTFPVARYKHLSPNRVIREMVACNRDFYSLLHILRRVWRCVWRRSAPLVSVVSNLSYRGNSRMDCKAYGGFRPSLEGQHRRATSGLGRRNPHRAGL